MGATRRLILENSMGQKVRAYRLDAERFFLIFRHDTRRVEVQSELESLDEAGIGYDILEAAYASTLEDRSIEMPGHGRLRMAKDEETLNPASYELDDEGDSEKLAGLLKRSAVGHLFAVGLILLLSVIMSKLADKKVEPELVTIQLPKTMPQPTPRVQVAQRPVRKTPVAARKVVNRPVKKTIARKTVRPSQTKKRAPVVRNAPERSMERVGALAALGGVKRGARNAEGLDIRSLKNIRSAGTGAGGGGVGEAGRGGVRGMLAGNGLVAGSSGNGARAQSAGGYGTRGAGGGRAGYGTISMVGGTSGLSLPLDEEAVVEGGLDRDQIAAVINSHRGQIIYCYEQGLRAQADLKGRVSVAFVIGPNGRLTKASVAQTSLNSDLVENCMIAKMKTWRFPRPVGRVSVDVLYPFDLRRVSQGDLKRLSRR